MRPRLVRMASQRFQHEPCALVFSGLRDVAVAQLARDLVEHLQHALDAAQREIPHAVVIQLALFDGDEDNAIELLRRALHRRANSQ